jgi:hypothetical protein
MTVSKASESSKDEMNKQYNVIVKMQNKKIQGVYCYLSKYAFVSFNLPPGGNTVRIPSFCNIH